jgi:hypothetical protein
MWLIGAEWTWLFMPAARRNKALVVAIDTVVARFSPDQVCDWSEWCYV